MAKSNKQINKEASSVAIDDSSPAVVSYRVGQLEKTQKEGFDRLEQKLDNLANGFVSHQQLVEAVKQGDLVHKNLDNRISKLEGWNTWIIRLVMGAVVLAGLALVFNGGIK